MKNSERPHLVFRAVVGDQNARSLLRWKLLRKDSPPYKHDLRKGDLVYDVGGYLSDGTCGMLEGYQCEYHVFEPHPGQFVESQNAFQAMSTSNCTNFRLAAQMASSRSALQLRLARSFRVEVLKLYRSKW